MTPDIKRILVPLDFGPSSTHALAYAHGLAQTYDAALHLVHVCETPGASTPSMEGYAVVYADWNRELGEQAERELAKAAATVNDLKVTTEVLFGHVASGIVDAAATNETDLIVMGTHGRGAMLHLVMGNVAERVVRVAPCPVLTVRQPKAPGQAARAPVAGLVASLAVAAAMLAPALVAGASAQSYQQTPGAEVFRTYCASCHGTAARGDGPLASSMTRKPANLTEIAKRNGGQFPTELVFKTIDGRQPVRGHGGPDMPVWGDVFTRSREAGDADRAQAVIQSLVVFLESIQLRPGYDK